MRRMLAVLTYALFISLACLSSLKAEENQYPMPFNFGVYGNLNVNMHSPNFNLVHPITGDLLKYNTNSSSYGGSLGLIANIPLSHYFMISGRIGFNSMGGEFTSSDTTLTKLTSTLNYIEFSPVLQVYNLIPVKNLYLLGGLEVGVPLSPSYTLDNSRLPSLKQPDKTLPDPSTRIAAAIGAGYTFQLSNFIYLTPEVSYRIPFSQVSSNAGFKSWDVPQIRAGLALTFSLKQQEEKRVIPAANKPGLNVGFREVRYYDKEGKTFPLKTIKVEDVQYTELFPIVPYVFFDMNSDTPSVKTQITTEQTEAGEFSVKNLEPDAILINNHTLDVIGSRMKEINNAELTLTGTNDNKKEAGNKSLSLKRAEFAKDYLVKKFGISAERINVRSTGLPSKPSAQSVEDGIEENRRVEFSSTNKALLEPILISSENQRLADPSLIEFLPFANVTNDSLATWQLEINQGSKLIRRYNGTGNINPLQWSIKPNELVDKQIPVDYALTVSTKSGLRKDARGSVPVEYFSVTRKKTEELPDKSISKFSLILFDFDKADVSDADKEIIEKYIVPAIKFNSTVQIYGYTDRIGDEEYNKKLSDKRAQAVKAILEDKVKSAKFETFGVGESNVIFNNDLPTGRQLSRTVQIWVVTPKAG